MAEEIKLSLAAARVNAGLTQDEVASMLGKTKQTIIKYENGTVDPRFSTVKEMSNIYGIPIQYLFIPKKST